MSSSLPSLPPLFPLIFTLLGLIPSLLSPLLSLYLLNSPTIPPNQLTLYFSTLYLPYTLKPFYDFLLKRQNTIIKYYVITGLTAIVLGSVLTVSSYESVATFMSGNIIINIGGEMKTEEH